MQIICNFLESNYYPMRLIVIFIVLFALGCSKEIQTNLPIADAEFLNEYYANDRGELDFTKARVVFYSAKGDLAIAGQEPEMSSLAVFKAELEDVNYPNADIGTDLLIMSDEQKANCGYDAAIVMWTFMYAPEDLVLDLAGKKLQ